MGPRAIWQMWFVVRRRYSVFFLIKITFFWKCVNYEEIFLVQMFLKKWWIYRSNHFQNEDKNVFKYWRYPKYLCFEHILGWPTYSKCVILILMYKNKCFEQAERMLFSIFTVIQMGIEKQRRILGSSNIWICYTRILFICITLWVWILRKIKKWISLHVKYH